MDDAHPVFQVKQLGGAFLADGGDWGWALFRKRPRCKAAQFFIGVGYAGEMTGRAETTRTPALEDATTGLTM